MGGSSRKLWPIAAAAALLVVSGGALVARRASTASYAQAREVVDRHCVGCHSERPTVPAFPIAAAGVMLDTAAQMRLYSGRIVVRVGDKRDMPLLNKTGMTEEEREVLTRWAEAGAEGP